MSEETGNRAAPQDVNDIVQRIDGSWRELMAALDGIPEERQEEPGAIGDWSIKNLLGHIAYWEEWALRHIDQALAGQPEDEIDDAAVDAMNQADHEARRDRTLPEERAALHQAHAAVVERLQSVAGLDAAQIDEAIRWDTHQHYDEHVPDIRHWRQRVGV